MKPEGTVRTPGLPPGYVRHGRPDGGEAPHPAQTPPGPGSSACTARRSASACPADGIPVRREPGATYRCHLPQVSRSAARPPPSPRGCPAEEDGTRAHTAKRKRNKPKGSARPPPPRGSRSLCRLFPGAQQQTRRSGARRAGRAQPRSRRWWGGPGCPSPLPSAKPPAEKKKKKPNSNNNNYKEISKSQRTRRILLGCGAPGAACSGRGQPRCEGAARTRTCRPPGAAAR